jgi:YbgC/YbaW family acyl-CoA thioester hydrolase
MKPSAHSHACEVAFADTDASGWMHFSNIFRYVEAAEHAFLKSRDVQVFDLKHGGWPRAQVSCNYQHPLRAGDRIVVLLEIERIGSSSLVWNFEILNPAGEIAAAGSMTTVHVNADGRPQKISTSVRAALERGL